MLNRLPEKLLKLRRHFNYSQQEAANLCRVDLIEYMSWENGRNLPNIEQLERLAEIFHLTLDEMIINSADIPLYDYSKDEIEIPFIEKKLDDTMPIPVLSILDKLDEEAVQEDEAEKTRMIPVQKLSEIKEVKQAEKKIESNKNNLKLQYIGILAIFLVVLVILIFSFNKPEEPPVLVWHNLEMKNIDRIDASEKAVLIINSDHTVSCYGSNDNGQCNVSSWNDIVAVSAGENHSVALRTDGTVAAAGLDRYGQSSVSLWAQIIDVSAGSNHTAAVTLEGKVLCVGDNSAGQCNTEEIENAVQVSAGKTSTAVLLNDGTVKVIGTFNDIEAVESWTDIKLIENGGDQIAAIKKDGTVVSAGKTAADSSWSNIIALSSYNGNLSALNASGSVFVLGDNSYGQCETEGWNQAYAIASGDGFTVMLTRDGELVGVGNNRYNIFEEEIIKEKLSMVSNVLVEIGSTIRFKWDSVRNASYYEILIQGIGSYRVSDSTLALPASRFVDGQDYTISIIAYPNNSLLMESDEYLSMFTYIAPLPSPSPSPTPIVTQTPEVTPEPSVEPEESIEPIVTPTPESTPSTSLEPTPSIEPTENTMSSAAPEDQIEPTETPLDIEGVLQ